MVLMVRVPLSTKLHDSRIHVGVLNDARPSAHSRSPRISPASLRHYNRSASTSTQTRR
jgi:hypothetical protein